MANFNKKNTMTATKQMTVKDLRTECKALGITGYSKLKKDELIKAIDDFKKALHDGIVEFLSCDGDVGIIFHRIFDFFQERGESLSSAGFFEKAATLR